MTERKIGIIMNGVTGRMGMHQHLVRSILAIRNQGGVKLPGGEVAIPDPILVGRNEATLAITQRKGGAATRIYWASAPPPVSDSARRAHRS